MNPIKGITWRSVSGFPYDVSSCGKVRNTKTGRVLKPGLTGLGYPQVRLYTHGKQISMLVHRLVAAAFIGPRPAGLVINHIDGDKQNNDVANLEYVTQSDNIKHAHRIGLTNAPSGQKHYNAKLTDSQVAAIRVMYANGGCTHRALAQQFGVGYAQIGRILLNKQRVGG